MTRWHELSAFCKEDDTKLTLISVSVNVFGAFRFEYVCPKCNHRYVSISDWLQLVEQASTLDETEPRKVN